MHNIQGVEKSLNLHAHMLQFSNNYKWFKNHTFPWNNMQLINLPPERLLATMSMTIYWYLRGIFTQSFVIPSGIFDGIFKKLISGSSLLDCPNLFYRAPCTSGLVRRFIGCHCYHLILLSEWYLVSWEIDRNVVVQEELGIETDEDVHCNIADYSNLGVKKPKKF